MKKLICVLLLAGLTAIAWAASPHFVRADASIDGDGSLVASFKIAGLGANESTLVSMSADASVTFGCKTHSGNFPSAANKEEFVGPVGASGEFTSGKNGSITASLTASPPAPSLVCPHGQTRVVCAASYIGVELSSDKAGTVQLGDQSSVPFPECL